MADLFIIRARLRFSLWLMAVAAVLAGLATWFFYGQIEFEAENQKFLLSAAITGALLLGWVGLLLFYLATKRIMDPSHNLTDRVDNLPWFILKSAALLVTISLLSFFVFRESANLENEFDLLRDGHLERLQERLTETPERLELPETKDGLTLVQVAYRENYPEALALLLNNGATTEEMAPEGINPLIASLGDFPMLGTLLEAGFDPNVTDSEGVPALHHAVAQSASNTVVALLEAGAKPDMRDRISRTALMLTIENDNLPMAGILLERGANVIAFDQRGNTPLHIAVRRNKIETVRFLLDKGADPRIFNFTHMTPMHLAAINSNLELVSLFLELPNMIGLVDENDRAPLDHALRSRKYETADLLISAGADVNRILANGNTILHDLIFARDYQTARYLIRKGADVRIPDAAGNTTYDIMRRKQLSGLLELVAELENPASGAESNAVEQVEGEL